MSPVDNRPSGETGSPTSRSPETSYSYQVVISASRSLAANSQQETISKVVEELGRNLSTNSGRRAVAFAIGDRAPGGVFRPSGGGGVPAGPAIAADQPAIGRRLDAHRMARDDGRRRAQRLSRRGKRAAAAWAARSASCSPICPCRCFREFSWASLPDLRASSGCRASCQLALRFCNRLGKRRPQSYGDPSTGALCGGSVTRKTVDSPGCESQVSCPPWDSTIDRLMGSPSPSPLDFVVKKRSKMRGKSDGAIPGPLSATAISAMSESLT